MMCVWILPGQISFFFGCGVLPRYYRTYIMANEFGELPHFACHGMLARTHAVQHVLSEKCPLQLMQLAMGRLGVEGR